MQKITWIIATNSHTAKFFEIIGSGENSDPKLVLELAAELDSNHEKSGRTFNSAGNARHGIEPHTDRREVEKRRFAEEISTNLTKSERDNRFEKLILLASPKMLGILSELLDNKVSHKIISKSPVNIADLSAHEVKNYLKNNH